MGTIGNRLYGLSQEPALSTCKSDHSVQFITMKVLSGLSKLKKYVSILRQGKLHWLESSQRIFLSKH